MRVAVIIMARMPYVGAVKKRLAADIGAQAATRLYRIMLSRAIAAAAVAAAAAAVSAHLALTPDDQLFPSVLPRLRQGGGDLGQRMERLAKRFPHAVIFIGSDSLMITADHIRTAHRALRSHEVVIAPSGDGGYGLIGMRNPHLTLFRNIRWSSAATLADTLARARHHRVCLLPPLPDIDCAEDLRSHKTRQKLGKIARTITAV